jgi:hypothetical protein
MQKAISGCKPGHALRAVVQELVAGGHSRSELELSLENLLLEIRSRADHREADEDAILDVLDALAGWCHESARL